jgi:hypothetical protein
MSLSVVRPKTRGYVRRKLSLGLQCPIFVKNKIKTKQNPSKGFFFFYFKKKKHSGKLIFLKKIKRL